MLLYSYLYDQVIKQINLRTLLRLITLCIQRKLSVKMERINARNMGASVRIVLFLSYCGAQGLGTYVRTYVSHKYII